MHIFVRLIGWFSIAAPVWLICGSVQAQSLPRYKTAYATFLGGSQWDQAREVIPYADGSVLIGAQVCSSDMPTTEGVVQPKYAGDDPALGHGGVYGGDCFLARLSPDGRRIAAATYFGGSKQERCSDQGRGDGSCTNQEPPAFLHRRSLPPPRESGRPMACRASTRY